MAGMPSAIDFDLAFAPDERWSSLFKSTPVLADSFEVLDDLLSLLDVVPPELSAEPQVTLLLRAMVLWDELRRRQPRAACEWAHLDNRPALRLLLLRLTRLGGLVGRGPLRRLRLFGLGFLGFALRRRLNGGTRWCAN